MPKATLRAVLRLRPALCAALCAALLLVPLAGCVKGEAEPTPKISYATEGVTAVEDPEALQKSVDEMFEKSREAGISLEFKNVANSSDGESFTCYIANAQKNEFDMFIAIYADEELSDELFLSGLLRPGQAFESLKLEKTLEPGDHTVYVAFTQVEEDLETIHNQVVVTMTFAVA